MYITLQLRGPHLIAARFFGQCDSLGIPGLTIGTLQILEQDTPGNAVDHKVMNNQQQPLAAIVHIEKHGAQQWTLYEIQAVLRLVAQRFQIGFGSRFVHP